MRNNKIEKSQAIILSAWRKFADAQSIWGKFTCGLSLALIVIGFGARLIVAFIIFIPIAALIFGVAYLLIFAVLTTTGSIG